MIDLRRRVIGDIRCICRHRIRLRAGTAGQRLNIGSRHVDGPLAGAVHQPGIGLTVQRNGNNTTGGKVLG